MAAHLAGGYVIPLRLPEGHGLICRVPGHGYRVLSGRATVSTTRKPGDVRRRVRRAEADLAIIQRACISVAGYTGARPPVLITGQELKVLSGGGAGITGERGREI